MKNYAEIKFAKKVARILLSIEAISFRLIFQTPYTWACGMKMRIYNDNRMLLAKFEHRALISRGFINLILKHNINPDFIIGTSTAGIAPAASVAQYMGKELLINNNGNFYRYNKNLWNGDMLTIFRDDHPDIIIATSPFAITYGIQLANNLGIGFAYIRNKKKDHGKEMQIEGIIKPGMRYVLIFSGEHIGEITDLCHMLGTEYQLEFCSTYDAINWHEKIADYELKNKKAVVIEDLFSTGGSAAMEVHKARGSGMKVNHCFSIFSYGFDCLKKQFSGESNIGNTESKLSEPCKIDSLLEFPILMEVIKKDQVYELTTITAMESEIFGFDERYEKHLADKIVMTK